MKDYINPHPSFLLFTIHCSVKNIWVFRREFPSECREEGNASTLGIRRSSSASRRRCARYAGQDGTLPPVVGDEVVQSTPLATNLDLPESLTTRVDAGVGTQEITLPEVTAEVGDDAASLWVEADSAAIGPSNRPSVFPRGVQRFGRRLNRLSRFG